MATVDGVISTGFEEASVPLRGELLAHCYRMLGSWDEAEDAVQETYLRGWRAWNTFEHNASVRTWLYRIATNVCIDAARSHTGRALPSGIQPPGDHPDGQSGALPPQGWIQPFKADHDNLRLALIAGLQLLSTNQRAVLLLRDALGFPATEVAGMLDISVPAVKSRLQRARARIAGAAPTPDDVVEPRAPEAQRLLDVYVAAFETGNVHALLAVMRADATLELVPARTWYAGKADCSRVLNGAVSGPHQWRMEGTIANGQPAVVAYQSGNAYGIAVLDVRRDAIAAITVFADPLLAEKFASVSGRVDPQAAT